MEDEAKSFLGALVKKDGLLFFFFAFISILLVALNQATIGTYTLNLQPRSIHILTSTALICAILGIWQISKKKKNNTKPSLIKAGDNFTQAIITSREELDKIAKGQRDVIESLKQAVKEIQNIAAQERSYASVRILEVIEGLNIALINYQESSLDSQRLAQWVRVRIDIWTEMIKPEDYPNISKNGKFHLFKEDIIKYLNLFCENIVNGVFKTPQKHHIKPHFDYSFAYKDALKFIRNQIILEIDTDEYPDFNQSQQQEILDYLDQLISDI